MDKFFVDKISQINYTGGAIRINFEQVTSFEPEIKSEEVVQLIITPESYADLLNDLEEFAEKLSENGVLERE